MGISVSGTAFSSLSVGSASKTYELKNSDGLNIIDYGDLKMRTEALGLPLRPPLFLLNGYLLPQKRGKKVGKKEGVEW